MDDTDVYLAVTMNHGVGAVITPTRVMMRLKKLGATGYSAEVCRGKIRLIREPGGQFVNRDPVQRVELEAVVDRDAYEEAARADREPWRATRAEADQAPRCDRCKHWAIPVADPGYPFQGDMWRFGEPHTGAKRCDVLNQKVGEPYVVHDGHGPAELFTHADFGCALFEAKP